MKVEEMREVDINRLVAEKVLRVPLEPPCAYIHSTDGAEFDAKDGWSGWCYTCNDPVRVVPPEPRDYCNDPRAREQLTDYLIAHDYAITTYERHALRSVELLHTRTNKRIRQDAYTTGHALAVAALKAYE